MDAKKKYTLADQRRRKKLHAKRRIFFMMKDCTRRARFKICALATACTGLVEIQTLRSVYETQMKKTVWLSGKRFIPLDKFEKRAQKEDFFIFYAKKNFFLV